MLAQFNLQESAVNIDYERLCNALPSTATSAIDAFYSVREATVSWAYAPPFSQNPQLRANLLLMIFSAAESYFRRILAETLAICPIAAEAAAQQQVPLGAISSLGVVHLGLIISDTKGLTSSGEIAGRTKTLLGIQIEKNSSLDVAIAQFERICTFRHSIVHSSGELLYNNRRELKVSTTGRLVVSLDDRGIQDIVQVVVNAVRSYNNHIGNQLLTRWFVSGHLTGGWPKDRATFIQAIDMFSSKLDQFPAETKYATYLKCRTTMKKNAKKTI